MQGIYTLPDDWSGSAPLMPSVRLGTGFVSVTVVTICIIPPSKYVADAIRLPWRPGAGRHVLEIEGRHPSCGAQECVQCCTAPTLPAGLTEALRAYLSALYDADTSCSTLESLNLLVSPNSCSNMLISQHTILCYRNHSTRCKGQDHAPAASTRSHHAVSCLCGDLRLLLEDEHSIPIAVQQLCAPSTNRVS